MRALFAPLDVEDREVFAVVVEDLAAVGGHDDQVLHANADVSGQVDAGLDGEDLPLADGLVVCGGDVARLVVDEADLVAKAMREVIAPAGVLDDLACGEVDLGKRHAGSDDLLGSLVGAAHFTSLWNFQARV